MRNFWSTTENLYLYRSYDGKTVYLANPESKKTFGPVRKISESIEEPEIVKNDGWNVRFKGRGVEIELSPSCWYAIGNWTGEHLVEQLEGASIENGVVSGVTFGFCSTMPDKTILLIGGSTLAQKAEDNFIRKVVLGLNKKTKKYIEGNTYCSDNMCTFLCLGKTFMHRKNIIDSDHYGTTESEGKYVTLFTNDIREGWTVEDYIKKFGLIETYALPPDTDVIENTIFITHAEKPLAKIEELITPRQSKLEDLWEEILEKECIEKKEEYTLESKLFKYANVGWIINLFNLSDEISPGVSEKTKEMMEEIVRSEFQYILFKFYDTNTHRNGLNVKDGMSGDDKAKALIALFTDRLGKKTHNETDRVNYVKSKFALLFQLDLMEIATEEIGKYRKRIFDITTFDDYKEKIGWYEYRSSEFNKRIEFTFTNEQYRNFENYIAEPAIRSVIKEIYKEAMETHGSNLERTVLTNLGTAKDPVVQSQLYIGLKDIMKHCGVNKLDDLGEDLKKDLVSSQYYMISILTRSDITINNL